MLLVPLLERYAERGEIHGELSLNNNYNLRVVMLKGIEICHLRKKV